jgi:hypothetical protein
MTTLRTLRFSNVGRSALVSTVLCYCMHVPSHDKRSIQFPIIELRFEKKKNHRRTGFWSVIIYNRVAYVEVSRKSSVFLCAVATISNVWLDSTYSECKGGSQLSTNQETWD